MNSWLLSMRWCERVATERAIDTASTSPSSAMASAPGARLRTAAVERSGHDSGGSRAGSEPTSRTPCSAPCERRRGEAAGDHRQQQARPARQEDLEEHRRDQRDRRDGEHRGIDLARCRKMFSQMWMNACCFVPGMPRKVLIWLVAISSAAPAVNPTTTEWEMKFDQGAEARQPERELERAGHEGQRQHHPDVLGAAGLGERGDGGEHDDRDRRRRPGDQVAGGAEQRGDHRRHDRASTARTRGQAGDHRERHALRQHDDRAGDAGQQVGARAAGGDQIAPAQERQQTGPVDRCARRPSAPVTPRHRHPLLPRAAAARRPAAGSGATMVPCRSRRRSC